jgi:hypothetical protein
MERRFTLNHSFIQLKAVFIFTRKSFRFGLVTSIVVSYANNIGMVLSFIVLGKSFM